MPKVTEMSFKTSSYNLWHDCGGYAMFGPLKWSESTNADGYPCARCYLGKMHGHLYFETVGLFGGLMRLVTAREVVTVWNTNMTPGDYTEEAGQALRTALRQYIIAHPKDHTIGMQDIDNARQNHPELVVGDLAPWVPPAVTRKVLKFRGVNKWLLVRRLLIDLKNRWKIQIQASQEFRRTMRKDLPSYWRALGYEEALIDCRQQVRALCHSSRDIEWPDNVRDFGDCRLPDEFPKHPHKRWLLRHRGAHCGRSNCCEACRCDSRT